MGKWLLKSFLEVTSRLCSKSSGDDFFGKMSLSQLILLAGQSKNTSVS